MRPRIRVKCIKHLNFFIFIHYYMNISYDTGFCVYCILKHPIICLKIKTNLKFYLTLDFFIAYGLSPETKTASAVKRNHLKI